MNENPLDVFAASVPNWQDRARHGQPSERLGEGLKAVENWAGAGNYGCKALLLDYARLKIVIGDWPNVFGHLSVDPNTAGNLINEKMARLETDLVNERRWRTLVLAQLAQLGITVTPPPAT